MGRGKQEKVLSQGEARETKKRPLPPGAREIKKIFSSKRMRGKMREMRKINSINLGGKKNWKK
jgi:hypothetical protein